MLVWAEARARFLALMRKMEIIVQRRHTFCVHLKTVEALEHKWISWLAWMSSVVIIRVPAHPPKLQARRNLVHRDLVWFGTISMLVRQAHMAVNY